ncbi:glycosyltransferase [Azotobacter chroococcum]|uniref:Glycosyl transferase, family 2 n=1 Tax=Azotobacter chroococcum NCIMB 8003 TaxID=1328314 RepID=A0A0C4WJY5_9GAMM|nr:glycosyltransferase [Azotobacter chroococcum]AJE22968.1 Glycosyl transferase, family 2 [Azotobacter chroococcum NCIMB 8003]
MAEAIFWLCLCLPLFAYLGYPALLALCALFRRPAPAGAPQELPRVSVIVAAYNEERNIVAKLRSLLDDDYPRERRQIIVASDGSSDATVTLARRVAQLRPWDDIRVLDLPRSGKAGALNNAVAVADGEILVFSDADTLWTCHTLRPLVAPFADPRVGATIGNVAIPAAGKALAIGDRLYRPYESWLRRLESRTGCLASADGGLQALRRSLFQTVPADVTDDFFLSTCAPVAGQRIVFAEAARVLDVGVESADNQFRRRRRITTRGLRSLARRRELLDPRRHGLLALGLFTHKLVRRLAPVLLIPLLLSSFWLWSEGELYRLALLAQLAGYGVAVIGLLGQRRHLPKPFHLAAYLLVTLAAMSAGVWQFLRGQRYQHWNPQQNR